MQKVESFAKTHDIEVVKKEEDSIELQVTITNTKAIRIWLVSSACWRWERSNILEKLLTIL